MFSFNSRGNLLSDGQSHGIAADGTEPSVDYAWAYSSATAANFDRLSQMTYPVRSGSTEQRIIGFDYGNNVDDLNSVLNRITRISDATLGSLAEYEYAGTGRRVSATYGYDDIGSTHAAAQSYAGTGGYPGLDRFGRPADLNYTDTAGITQARHEYGYDKGGNRLHARTTQQNGAGAAEANERSWLYLYDQLNRLVGADAGALDGSNASILASTRLPVPRQSTWTLDDLGNWAGEGSTPGLAITLDLDGDGIADYLNTTHSHDELNKITEIVVDDGGTPVTMAPIYDPSGNLVADADYHYQYDGWGRLVSVSAKGSLNFLMNGHVDPVNPGTPGPWVSLFSYDGLGRLVRKLSPFPGAPGEWRTEHYYYDGVRRIQEVLTDPLISVDPLSLEEEAAVGGPQYLTWTDREYVHSPGYVDEVVCQIDRNSAVMYTLADGN